MDTPLLSTHLIPEASIENFSTPLISPYSDDIPLFLIPSPELHMKELMAAGSGDIYQICKCFRNSEQISPVHNPEFTMLEWYKTGISADENIRVCEELIESLFFLKHPRPAARPSGAWRWKKPSVSWRDSPCLRILTKRLWRISLIVIPSHGRVRTTGKFCFINSF